MSLGNLGKGAAGVMIHIKGDESQYQKALSNANNSTNTFASSVSRYGKAMGLALGTAAVGFAAMSIKMAAAEEVVSRRTSALLKAQGVAWDDVSESVDAYMKRLELLTSYNDTDLQEAFNQLIASGMSYTEAMESMNTVTSMAYSLNRDLTSMSMLVGKAFNGQTGELSRYGIVLDDTLSEQEKFAGLTKYVADNFADASDRTGTLSGQLDVLKNSAFNIAEEMGAELLPDLITHLESLNKWGQDGGWKDTGDAIKSIAEALMNLGYAAAMVTDVVGMAYHTIFGAFDKGGAAYYDRFDEDMLSDEQKAARDRYAGLADYHSEKGQEETDEFGSHYRKWSGAPDAESYQVMSEAALTPTEMPTIVVELTGAEDIVEGGRLILQGSENIQNAAEELDMSDSSNWKPRSGRSSMIADPTVWSERLGKYVVKAGKSGAD